MTFKDIIKSGYLDSVTAVSAAEMAVTLLLAFCLGVLIFLVYKKTYQGVLYSTSFGVTLIGLTMVTSMVIMAVTSNVVLSLGMVGALSIVRFRTAIKEPLDIVFLFWAIAAGLVLAAGMELLAVIGSLLIGVVLLVSANLKPHSNPYILVLRCEDSLAEQNAWILLDGKVKRCQLKSKTVQHGQIELHYQIRLVSDNTDFVNELTQLQGVASVALVSFNGEYMN